MWLVWVTGRVQSPQGADEGSPPSGAPMRDAGKPSLEQLELWAAVLVDEAALWVRRAWPQDPGPCGPEPRPLPGFQAVTGSSHNLKLPFLL